MHDRHIVNIDYKEIAEIKMFGHLKSLEGPQRDQSSLHNVFLSGVFLEYGLR